MIHELFENSEIDQLSVTLGFVIPMCIAPPRDEGCHASEGLFNLVKYQQQTPAVAVMWIARKSRLDNYIDQDERW